LNWLPDSLEKRRLVQVIPDSCDSRIANLALLMLGMVKGQNVQVGM
jgi:hypothetical protein